MKFSFLTEYPEVVSRLFAEFAFSDLFVADYVDVHSGENVVKFRDDGFYGEVVAWATHAFGCGLITRPYVERA